MRDITISYYYYYYYYYYVISLRFLFMLVPTFPVRCSVWWMRIIINTQCFIEFTNTGTKGIARVK